MLIAEKVLIPMTAESLARNKDSFNLDLQKCYETQKKFRLGAMCAACSGNADSFFSNGKLIISKGLSKELNSNCMSVFLYTYNMMQAAKISYFLRKLSKADKSVNPSATMVEDEFTAGIDLISQNLDNFAELKPLAHISKEFLRLIDMTDHLKNFLLFDGINPDTTGDETLLINAIQSLRDYNAEFERLPEQEKTDQRNAHAATEIKINALISGYQTKNPGFLSEITVNGAKLIESLKELKTMLEAEKIQFQLI